MEWLYSIGVVTMIGLQSWILQKLVGLEITLTRHDQQIGRITSDAESEKGTRKRRNDDIEARLRMLERHHE